MPISRTNPRSTNLSSRVRAARELNPITTAISRVHDSAIYSAETGGAALHSYEIDIQPCRNGRALASDQAPTDGEQHRRGSLLLELALDVGDQRLALLVHLILRVEQRASFFVA